MAWLPGCGGSNFYGPLSRPAAAHIDIPEKPLAAFDADSRPVLFRYLSGNPRWEICEERGFKYAVRRESVHGKYETTLNGFYLNPDGGSADQTRVLIVFERSHGFGVERGNVTRARPGAAAVPVVVEGPHDGVRGNSSYLIVEGDRLYVEIYEQAVDVSRPFTRKALTDVFAELSDVLTHQDEIQRTGVLPVESHYPIKHPNEAQFTVSDAGAPGIYQLSGAINFKTPGYAYAKVFDATSGNRLSESHLTPSSIRYVGWAASGETFFPYNSEVKVSEGDWSNQYSARFELWHKTVEGAESKVAETTRMINGYER